jgi:hypothetical protein
MRPRIKAAVKMIVCSIMANPPFLAVPARTFCGIRD